MVFQKGEKIILTGDSITDSGRMEDPDGLGFGYVRMISDYCSLNYPDSQFRIVNKGISGDRVIDLKERWEKDIIKEQPDWVSISIGINDVWRQLDENPERPVYIDEYVEVYEQLIQQTMEQANAKVILLETTVIDEELNSEGNQLLAPYNEKINELAKKYGALLVPMNQAFHDYLSKPNKAILTTDGVHMNSAGNMLMATTWIKACGI